jgi:shikimate kinase/3-dehydroquinate synthase
MDQRNIVLTGFMGTGKTSAGRALAQMLDREFVDMDTWLEAREGMPLAELFRQKGETYFRAQESALCRELAAGSNLVIATGGGALVSAENRALFANAHLVCLDASVDEILRRLDGAQDRPLLGDNPRANVEKLLAARRDAYAQIRLHIQTDGQTPEQIAQTIAARLAPRELRVQTPRGEYSIHLGHDLLEHIGTYLKPFALAQSCAVVTNPTVRAWYGARVVAALERAGFEPVVIEIPDGEPSKNLDTVRGLYDQFIAAKLERRSPILALGGGVIGDTVGFAAATYLRGVPFVQIPTTLLAMVDSSIGGKVAVDHPAGKNLIGAFKFPLCVMADMTTLDTLPVEEYRAGMAEVIKHGILGDAALFDALRTRQLDDELLARALQVKVDIVERDPFEEHERAHLNLGHTFGQAIEALANFQMRHGYAVAIGTACAARLAANLNWCHAQTRDEIIALLEQYELPTRIPRAFSPAQILAAMGTDKKIKNKRVRFILPYEIGRVGIAENVTEDQVTRALRESY